jgi:hypothetical protein
MTFLGTGMLVGRDFLIFALAVGDEGYTKKARFASTKPRHNTRRLVFVIVGIIIVRISVMACSCHDKTQAVTRTSYHENPLDNDADDDKDESSGIVSQPVVCGSGFFGISFITHS